MSGFDFDELEEAIARSDTRAAHVAAPAASPASGPAHAEPRAAAAPTSAVQGVQPTAVGSAQRRSGDKPRCSVGGGLTLAWAGKYRHNTGFYEVIKVDRDLRYRQKHPVLGVLRGVLRASDEWHMSTLSGGWAVRLRCGDDANRMVLSLQEPGGRWSPEITAEFVDPHQIEPEEPVSPEVVQNIRGAAGSWTPSSRGPPEQIVVLNETVAGGQPVPCLVPNPLSLLAACHCPPYGKRLAFLSRSLGACEENWPKGQPLVYASLGSGRLWFDWWVLEGLLAAGFKVREAHFIDNIFSDEDIRNAGEATSKSALSQMAAWLGAVGVSIYAYYDMACFLRSAFAGTADVLVQCDADCQGVDLAPAMRTNGLHLFLQQDSALQMIARLGEGAFDLLLTDASECNGDKGVRRSDRQ